MKILFLFILIFHISHVNADEIYNLIKIPNLEIYKLKNDNNIRYLSAKGNFKIGANKNITCDKVDINNLNSKFPLIEKNLNRYNSNFFNKIKLKYIVFCENLFISEINTGGIPDNKNRTLILDINFNKKYFERMIHHEIFHMIQNTHIEYFDEEKFSSFNLASFNYAECSTCTDKLGLDTYPNTNGFISEYSQSTASEDMAEVYSHIISKIIPKKIDPILKSKINFIKEKLELIDQDFKI